MTSSQNTTSRDWRGGSLASLSAASILALAMLSACSSVPAELSVLTVPIQVDRPTERPPLPNPSPIETRWLRWTVLTPETLPRGDDWVFFGLTPQAYEDLSLNQADTQRFIDEAMWLLNYYTGE